MEDKKIEILKFMDDVLLDFKPKIVVKINNDVDNLKVMILENLEDYYAKYGKSLDIFFKCLNETGEYITNERVEIYRNNPLYVKLDLRWIKPDFKWEWI